ncbi:MAG: hypothetical protein HIU92_13990 [Proteobacteria bacterium]|nr:hypothetical protein [Pseudomonadota bacterium]
MATEVVSVAPRERLRRVLGHAPTPGSSGRGGRLGFRWRIFGQISLGRSSGRGLGRALIEGGRRGREIRIGGSWLGGPALSTPGARAGRAFTLPGALVPGRFGRHLRALRNRLRFRDHDRLRNGIGDKLGLNGVLGFDR